MGIEPTQPNFQFRDLYDARRRSAIGVRLLAVSGAVWGNARQP
jgi:hypothetical protein